MKITNEHRIILIRRLKEFYANHPNEQFTVFQFVKQFKERHKKNKQTYVGVAGEAGSGKSLFCLTSMILYARPMDLNYNIVYIPDGDEISKKLQEMEFNVLLVDEAARALRALDFAKSEQKKVTMLAQTERFRRNWIFLCLPNFQEFTKSLRTGSIIFRIIVLYRTTTYARIVLHRRSKNWRESADPWYDKESKKLYEKALRRGEITNERMLGIERKSPSYIMDFIIPNLSKILPEVVNCYEKIKEDSRKKMEEQDKPVSKVENKYKTKYELTLAKVTKLMAYNTLHFGDMKVTNKDIAEALGLSYQVFNKYKNMPIEKFDNENATKKDT